MQIGEIEMYVPKSPERTASAMLFEEETIKGRKKKKKNKRKQKKRNQLFVFKTAKHLKNITKHGSRLRFSHSKEEETEGQIPSL